MVSITMPVIRLASAAKACRAARDNAGIDPDKIELVVGWDRERIGCPRMLKRLVKRARHDLIMFIGDDSIPQPGYLKAALDVMATLPDGWGLVGFNDEFISGITHATHWLADVRMLDILDGEFFHTGYRHCFCDNELSTRAVQAGRYAFAPAAIVKHNHPIIQKKSIKTWLILLGASIIGTSIGAFLYTEAARTAGANVMALLASASPLFSLPLTYWINKEKISKEGFVGVVLTVIGVVVILL